MWFDHPHRVGELRRMRGVFKWLVGAAVSVCFGCSSDEPAIITQARIAVERAVRNAQLEHRLPGITHATKEVPDKCSGDAEIHRVELVNVGDSSTNQLNQPGNFFVTFRLSGRCSASGGSKNFQADGAAILIKNGYGQIESATIRITAVNL